MELIGQTLGKYHILTELGHGGMASVYLAEDSSSGRRFALKIPHPHTANYPEVRKRFEREAKLGQQLRHPHVARVFGLEREGRYSFLVMENLEGGTLSDRIRGGRLSWEEALPIVRQTAEALHYAHGQNVVHRDVKPSNILFDGVGNVRLADFGIAHDTMDETITRAGEQPGTLAYMAAEQIDGKKIDARTDQFALATVFYQMISAQLPFAATSSTGVREQISKSTPIPLPQNVRAPKGAKKVLKKAHHKNPAKRYDSIIEFVKALENLSFSSGITTTIHLPSPVSWPFATSRRRLAVTVVAVLFVAVFAIYAFWGEGEAGDPTPTATSPITATQPPPPADEGPSASLPGTEAANTPVPPFTLVGITPSPTNTPEKTKPAPPLATQPKSVQPKQPKAPSIKPQPPTSTDSNSERTITLSYPASDASGDKFDFSWEADFTPGSNEAFELIVWPIGKERILFGRSPVGSRKQTEVKADISELIESDIDLREGQDYYWGVCLVRTDLNYERQQCWGERRIRYSK